MQVEPQNIEGVRSLITVNGPDKAIATSPPAATFSLSVVTLSRNVMGTGGKSAPLFSASRISTCRARLSIPAIHFGRPSPKGSEHLQDILSVPAIPLELSRGYACTQLDYIGDRRRQHQEDRDNEIYN
jgi:hypothetical protein